MEIRKTLHCYPFWIIKRRNYFSSSFRIFSLLSTPTLVAVSSPFLNTRTVGMLIRLSPDLILNQGTVADLYNRYQSTISQIPNPTLSWERTKSWNFGIDLELFNLFNMNLE